MIETRRIAAKSFRREGLDLSPLHCPNSWRSLRLTIRGGAVLTIVLIVANSILPSGFQANLGGGEFAKIARLHDQGWEEREKGNSEASERLFREAERKLKEYRGKYIKDRTSLPFLRATYGLAYLSELGNRDKDARKFYEQCLAHSLISSAAATFDKVPISQVATKRLAVIEGRSRQRSKSSGEDYPRISIRGGSKGEKDLPDRSSDLRP